MIEGNYDKLIEFSRNYTQYGDPASADPASIDPASASSASGGTDEPLPELVEGSGGTGGAVGRGEPPERADSGEFGEGGGW